MVRLSDRCLPNDYTARTRCPVQQMAPLKHRSQRATRDLGHLTRDSIAVLDIPWSTFSDVHTCNAQQIPHDVSKSDDESIWDDRATLIDKLDRMVLDIDFDHSCLDTLDDQLLLHPTDSFADICWADAVDDHVATATRFSPPQLRPHFESSSTDDDSDDSRTYQSTLAAPFYPGKANISLGNMDDSPRRTILNPSTDDGETSFIFLHPHFTTSDPSESVNFFPTSPNGRHRADKNRGLGRITAFCANLPGRLGKTSA